MEHYETRAMIKRHEGYSNNVYIDSVGVPTGGYGHAFHEGSKLPDIVWEQIFDYDYLQAVKDYDSLGLLLDPVRKAVIIDMLFNLGLTKLLKFKKMLKALRSGDWEKAAYEMQDSDWYGQVRTRAVRLVRMMRTGKA